MTTRKDPRNAEHYVNNKDFTAAAAEYDCQQVSQAVELQKQKGNSP